MSEIKPDYSQIKILIIEDEKHIRQSFADFLEDRDFNVIQAGNGQLGLELLKSEHPDLVLLDLRMPEMDGLEVLKQGKTILPDLPIIVISGANRVSDVVSALRLGAWDYLEKPVREFSILGHTVDTALEKTRLVRENRAYQERLEIMVKERTQALEHANNHLSNINARLHKIVETTQGLTGFVNMDRFGVRLLNEFASHMAASGGSLYLTEDKGLRLLHSLDPGHALDFLPFPLNEKSIINRALKDGEPLLVCDLKDKKNIESSGWSGYRDGSLLVFPIKDGNDNHIGVITLHSKNQPPFIEQDKEVGTILASHSCETIRAIRAYEESQKNEKRLRQAQKMEAIGTLAGGIAHDFNNILSGIIGYTQLATANYKAPEKIKGFLEQVMKGASRASELVKQILSFSRQNNYELKPLKIALIVKEAVKFLESTLPSTIEMVHQIEAQCTVLADPTQIHQIVMNLCTNASHAMRETSKGTLTVSLREIEFAAEELDVDHQPGMYVELEVQDTGIGIKQKILNRIFDPYFSTKEVTEGTGLGLAVVTGIVKKHNGFIRVSSLPGVGTAFKVYFPRVEVDRNASGLTESDVKQITGMGNIMLVDDEPDIMNSMELLLTEMGYTVDGFTDALSALVAFEKDPARFDLVITDMTMPKMDGRTLSKQILQHRPDTPVFLCTGFHETYNEQAALKDGIRRFMQKPLNMPALAVALREELKKEE